MNAYPVDICFQKQMPTINIEVSSTNDGGECSSRKPTVKHQPELTEEELEKLNEGRQLT